MRDLATFRMLECGLKYFIMPNKRRKTKRRRRRRPQTASQPSKKPGTRLSPINSPLIALPPLLLLSAFVCLNLMIAGAHCAWWPFAASDGVGASSSAAIHNAGAELASPTSTTEGDTSDRASLVRLAGEQAQFECQLSPLVGPPNPGHRRRQQQQQKLARDAARSRRGVSARLQDGALIDGRRARGSAHLQRRRARQRPGGSRIMEQAEEGAFFDSELDDNEEGDEAAEGPTEDSVELILWYRSGGDDGSSSLLQPIYSVDARQSHLAEPQQQQQQQQQQPSSSPLVPIAWRQQAQLTANNSTQTADGSIIKSSDNSEQLNYGPGAAPGKQYAAPNGGGGGGLLANVISGRARHYAAANLSSRVRLLVRQSRAHLIMDRVGPEDAGQYKCRVDFRFARTQYQVAQLNVIAPVRLLQIKATDSRGIDLWPASGMNSTPASAAHTGKPRAPQPVMANDLQQQQQQSRVKSNEMAHIVGAHRRPHHHHAAETGAGPADTARSLVRGPVEANEDETMDLECAAKDGWPRARISWWRADWPSGGPPDSGFRLAHLRSPMGRPAVGDGKLRIRVPTDEGPTGAHNGATASGGQDHHSINTTASATMEGALNGLWQQTNNGQGGAYVTKPPAAAAAAATADDNKAPGANVNISAGLASGPSDDLWTGWMSSRLESALARFVAAGQQHNLLQDERHTWTALVEALEMSLEADWAPSSGPEVGAKRGGQAEWVRILRQSSATLYICGASNTLGAQVQGLDQRRQDVLAAQSRPALASILVRPIARPKWIQMFLVGRRLLVGSPEGASGARNQQQVELTPLEPGQSLQLNLAPFGKGELGQLQFACQVGGSLPEARLEWTRTLPAGPHDNSSTTSNNSTNNNNNNVNGALDGGSTRMAELLDGRFESLGLALNGSTRGAPAPGLGQDGKPLSGATWSPGSGRPQANTQWALLRLHNISLPDHRTEIRCSAFNERFRAADGGRVAQLSTFVRLNITHAPVLRLELESGDPASANNEPDALHTRAPSSPSGQLKTEPARPPDDELDDKNADPRTGAKGGGQIKPILVGQNVTLACVVAFANPAIEQPIEWSVNDSLSLAQAESERLLRVLARESQHEQQQQQQVEQHTTNRYHFIERLMVQFGGGDGSQLAAGGERLQLKCRARNSVGQATSGRLRLVIGRSPHCPNQSPATGGAGGGPAAATSGSTNSPTTPSYTDNSSGQDDKPGGYSTLDNNLSVHCPVIRGGGGAGFRWLVEGKSGRAITYTETADIEMSKLNLPLAMDGAQEPADNSAGNSSERLKISCSASDKFGSNHNSPCQVVLLAAGRKSSGASGSGGEDDATINRAANYCAANVVQRSLVQKRQQEPATAAKKSQENNRLGDLADNQQLINTTADYALETAINSNNQLVAYTGNGGGSSKPRLLLSIQCKDNQFQAGTGGATTTTNQEQDADSKRDGASGQGARGLGRPAAGARNELIHFDLYHKRDTRFIKHLTSYPNLGRGGASNLSLVLDLGNELESVTLDDIEKQHFIVMSFTDANNRPRQPNVTLHLNAAPGLRAAPNPAPDEASDQQQLLLWRTNKQSGLAGSQTPADMFQRSGDPTGHQDRLWVISSIVAVFLSSFVLVIIAWVCKSSASASNGSMGNNNKSQGSKNAGHQLYARQTGGGGGGGGSGGSNNNGTGGASPEVGQVDPLTEMYLLGGGDLQQQQQQRRHHPDEYQSQPAAYHNARQQDDRLALLSGDSSGSNSKDQFELQQPVSRATNTFATDFLIIDPTQQQRAHCAQVESDSASSAGEASCPLGAKQQPAILLIDSHHQCGSLTCAQPAYKQQQQVNDTIGCRYHIEPATRLRPSGADWRLTGGQQQPPDATLRRNYCAEPMGVTQDEWRLTSTRSSSSNSALTPDTATSHLGSHRLAHQRYPLAADQASPANGLNFELNSQGELTMTDESSSFVHEQEAVELVCCRCPSSLGADAQATGARSLLAVARPLDSWPDCRANCWSVGHPPATSSRPLIQVVETDLNRGGSSTTLPYSQYLVTEPKHTQQAPLSSTLKRNPPSGDNNNGVSRRAERVRFLDHQLGGEHDSPSS